MNAFKKGACVTKRGRSVAKLLEATAKIPNDMKNSEDPINPLLQVLLSISTNTIKDTFIILAGRLVSFPTKRNGRSRRILSGSGGRASWEAVCAFCENTMFLETWGRIIMVSDDGQLWLEVIVESSVCFVKIQYSLTLGSLTRCCSAVVLINNSCRKVIKFQN